MHAAASGRLRVPHRSIAPGSAASDGAAICRSASPGPKNGRNGAGQETVGELSEECGEPISRPDLRRPVRGRAKTDNRTAGWQQGRGACAIGWSGPDNRSDGADPEHGRVLLEHPAWDPSADGAPAGRDKIRNERAAHIDNKIPGCEDDLAPKFEPVQVVRLLHDDDCALPVRHVREYTLGNGTTGYGDAGISVDADQVIEDTAGNHRIADAVG